MLFRPLLNADAGKSITMSKQMLSVNINVGTDADSLYQGG